MEMKEIDSQPFEDKGKNYEIKVFQTGNTFTVKAYLGNKEANCYSYSIDVTNSTKDEWNWDHEKEPCKRLIDIVEDDIKNGFGILPQK